MDGDWRSLFIFTLDGNGSKTMWREGFVTEAIVTHWTNTWVECWRWSWRNLGPLEFRLKSFDQSCKLHGAGKQCVIRLKKFLHTTAQPGYSHVSARAGFKELLVLYLWQTCFRTDHLLKTFFWCLKTKIILSLVQHCVRWPKIFEKIKEKGMSYGILVYFPVQTVAATKS